MKKGKKRNVKGSSIDGVGRNAAAAAADQYYYDDQNCIIAAIVSFLSILMVFQSLSSSISDGIMFVTALPYPYISTSSATIAPPSCPTAVLTSVPASSNNCMTNNHHRRYNENNTIRTSVLAIRGGGVIDGDNDNNHGSSNNSNANTDDDDDDATQQQQHTTSSSTSSTSTTTTKRRGKILRQQFDESDLLRAYYEIKNEYRTKAFGGSDNSKTKEQQGWKVLATINPNKKGNHNNHRHTTTSTAEDADNYDDETITVSMLEHASDPLCPYVKMTAILPVPVEECWDFLSLEKWETNMPKMDPFFEGIDIYSDYSISIDDTDDDKTSSSNSSSSSSSNSNDDGKENDDENNNNNDNNNINTNKKQSRIIQNKTKKSSGHANNKDKNSEDTTTTTTTTDTDTDTVIRMILARKRTKRILTFGKREFVFVSVMDQPLDDGTWVSGTVSVEIDEDDKKTKTDDENINHDNTNDNDDNNNSKQQKVLPSLKRNKSYTRAFQDSIAFYKPIFDNGNDSGTTTTTTTTNTTTQQHKTKLTIICRIDLNDSSIKYGTGGCIPMWLYVKTIGITGARSVLNMRNALLKASSSSSDN